MRARHFSFSILPRKKHRNVARPSPLKEHSTLKSLCRGTKNRSDLARHAAVFVLPRASGHPSYRTVIRTVAVRYLMMPSVYPHTSDTTRLESAKFTSYPPPRWNLLLLFFYFRHGMKYQLFSQRHCRGFQAYVTTALWCGAQSPLTARKLGL
jgi:hypothetical protein